MVTSIVFVFKFELDILEILDPETKSKKSIGEQIIKVSKHVFHLHIRSYASAVRPAAMGYY